MDTSQGDDGCDEGEDYDTMVRDKRRKLFMNNDVRVEVGSGPTS
jgi:hypothetical protein